MEYNSGWYSICICNNFEIPFIEEENLSETLNNDSIKYVFLRSFIGEDFERYLIIRKSWVLIDSYNRGTGLTRKKISILKKFTFDYFYNKKIIIFHSGIAKIESAIKYLNTTTLCNITILKDIDLFEFIKKLSSNEFNFVLLEGTLINYESEGGTIGNFHFKGITEKDKTKILNQNKSYLSWIKIRIINELKSFEFIFYSNGTFFQNNYNKYLFKLLTLYINLRGT